MKKILAFLGAVTLCGGVSAVSPSAAEDGVVYGTMNIPYADFYRAEFFDSSNAYEVDAVSSATTSKWAMNEAGKLFEGTYNQANEDGTGKILGVTYPVAVSRDDLELLGSDNFSFTGIDYEPQAYKKVTVNNGKAEFSAVQDSTPVRLTGPLKLSTSTAWGDYLLEVDDRPEDMGAIYGAVVKTSSGKRYAMRHEENIWRGELAWSAGITTTEPHGNTLSYKNFESMMGETIDEVTFITLNGYYSAAADIYVPVKFSGGEISIENGNAGTSSTSFSVAGFPADYVKTYTADDSFSVKDDRISYTDVQPGSYKLSVNDANGKYASFSASFLLTSDAVPAVYRDGKIVKAENASDRDYANYMKNISKINVSGTDYSVSGRGAVKIIAEDGTIDFKAESRNGAVFDGTGNYEITLTATGYNTPLMFRTSSAGEEKPSVTEATDKPAQSPATTAVSAVTSSDSSSTVTSESGSKTTAAGGRTTSAASLASTPKTGDKGIISLIFAAAAMGAVAVFTRSKKSK